jgi:hypothetical protein
LDGSKREIDGLVLQRHAEALAAVESGAVVTEELPVGQAVDIRKQGDLNLYSDVSVCAQLDSVVERLDHCPFADRALGTAWSFSQQKYSRRGKEGPSVGEVLRTNEQELCCDFLLQQFNVITEHKPAGRKWVTKEQYIRFFLLCYSVLYPDNDMTEAEKREALGVRLFPHAHSRLLVQFQVCQAVVFIAGRMGERQRRIACYDVCCVFQSGV